MVLLVSCYVWFNLQNSTSRLLPPPKYSKHVFLSASKMTLLGSLNSPLKLWGLMRAVSETYALQSLFFVFECGPPVVTLIQMF